MSFTREARDVLIECCVEFLTLISSEANEIAERETKKTIATEHIEKALRELGFPEYVEEVVNVAEDHREQLKVFLCGALVESELTHTNSLGVQTREKKTNKMDQSGLTQEELLQQQQDLFRTATDKYNQGPAQQ